jgi:hypothetical protein
MEDRIMLLFFSFLRLVDLHTQKNNSDFVWAYNTTSPWAWFGSHTTLQFLLPGIIIIIIFNVNLSEHYGNPATVCSQRNVQQSSGGGAD